MNVAGQQVVLNVIYHYLDLKMRPVAMGELRGLVDGFGRSFQGRPIIELLSNDSRFVRTGDEWGLSKWHVYTALDVETTGLSPRDNRITEIAMVRIWGTQVVGKWSTLINPGCSIPPYITRLTGISNQMVADAPSFAEIAQTIVDYVGQSTILAHNASFDRGFVNTGLKRAGLEPLPNKWVDTVSMARKLLPQLPNRKLVTVAHHFGISSAGHHRAMADSLMVAGIFREMCILDQELEEMAAVQN